MKSREHHGMYERPEYRCWQAMRARCSNPNNNRFHCYGGRGITVCHEWNVSFLTFYVHMGPRPTSTHTLDRIDNNCNYEPGNVRWATRAEQNSNLRKNVLREYRGTKMTVAQASRVAGQIVSAQLATNRVLRGWDVAAAVETPIQKRGGQYACK